MKQKMSIAAIIFLIIFQIYAQKRNISHVDLQVFHIENTSIRAIELIDRSTVWFAGSQGKYGRIINSEIQIDSVSRDGNYSHFRSIAFNGKHIFILSIEDPAVLYKINPSPDKISKPEIVYLEHHKNVFYDSMAFFDKQNGIAMGDPTEDCLSVILTKDAGNSWGKINCKQLPDVFEGEAAFAASNSNIAIFKKKVWLATGGKSARVFYSEDLGKNWTVVGSPIIQGSKMTGIYSIDFYDENNGIIMGGDWENKSGTKSTKASTKDGGKTWQLIANKEIPGYISCVQYVPKTRGKEIVAVSTEGIYYSGNKGESWKKISDEGFFSIRFIDKNSAWLSGNNKIAKMQLLNNKL